MRQRPGLFGGIAVLACGTVVLQIALSRLYSALFGQHVAFLAGSLALLGIGLGALALHLVPSLARPPALLARLAYLAGGSSAATVVALLVLLHTKALDPLDAAGLGRLAILYATSSLPFVLAGAAFAGAARHAGREAGRLFLLVFAGAAAGALGSLALLRIGAPRACLVVGVLQASSGIVLYFAARRASAEMGPEPERRASGAVVSTFALAMSVLLAGDLGAPWLKMPSLRWAPIEKAELQQWGELGLVTVDKPSAGTSWIRTDGTFGSTILDPKTTPPLHPDEMAYVLHKDKGPVLVVGAGGGRDVRAALRYGQKEIYAAELDPAIVGVMRDHSKAFSGDLYGQPQVHVAVADGRGYVRRAGFRFRNIVVSLADAAAPLAAGALSLTASSLYTAEAFRDYVTHLEPEGTLVVARPDGEIDRLLAVAAAGLRRAGAEDPAQHLFACSAAKSTALLVKRTPFSPTETATLRRHCKKNKFAEIFAPDQPRADARRKLVEAPESALDPAPPTDDRPFFFHAPPAGGALKLLGDLKTARASQQGLLMAAGLLGLGLVLALVALAATLGRRAASMGPAGRPLVFFASAGAGAVLIELGAAPHLSAFLGHPAYALSTVLVAMLLWAAVGALGSSRIEAPALELAAGRRAQLLVAAAALCAAFLGPALDLAAALPFAARLGLALALLAPLGLLLGALVPLAVRLVAAGSPDRLPSCWALAGLAAVVAYAGGSLLALALGHSALLLAGGAACLVAAAAAPRAPAGDATAAR